MDQREPRGDGVKKKPSIGRQGSSRQRTPHAHSAMGELTEIVTGILVQVGRKYLLVKPAKKVLVYLTAVLIFSLFAAYVPLSDGYYLVQKGNVLNQYGVKLGWFWTCFVVGPFVWFAARAHGKDPQGAGIDLGRIIVATGFWYFCTNSFVAFEQMTGHCHGALSSARGTCHKNGGRWVPGFDISGHCFILIYSILVICEEASSFRQLQVTRKRSPQNESSQADNYVSIARIYFLLMLGLHLLWDFELLISVLYYHHIVHKMLGAGFAVICWFITYRAWYPTLQFPPMPVNLKTKPT